MSQAAPTGSAAAQEVSRLEQVPIDEITVREGQPEAASEAVESLADSIRNSGLLEPIGVTPDLRLIFGAHRLAACRSLGWTSIPAMIHDFDDLRAELAGIDENIRRRKLSKLEEAQALARRKEIYEQLNPSAAPVNKRGGPGRGKKRQGTSEVPSFAEDTAKKTGKSARTIQRAVKIGRGIDPEAAELLRDTPVADNGRKLVEIAKLRAQEQVREIQRLKEAAAQPAPRKRRALGAKSQDPCIRRGLTHLDKLIEVLRELDAYDEYAESLDAIREKLQGMRPETVTAACSQTSEEDAEWSA